MLSFSKKFEEFFSSMRSPVKNKTANEQNENKTTIKSDICVLLHSKILTTSLRGKREMCVLV